MKKRIFALMAVILFTSSSMNLNADTNPSNYYDCVDFALDFVDAYENQHGCQTAEGATWLYQTAFAICETPSLMQG